MPIKPENRDKYPDDWPEIRKRILEREGHACKFCRAPNHTKIVRLGGTGLWAPAPLHAPVGLSAFAAEVANHADWSECWRDERGEWRAASTVVGLPARYQPFVTEVVLTVAHLDNDLVDHSDANLAALCQRCHLTHDARARKTAATADQIALL